MASVFRSTNIIEDYENFVSAIYSLSNNIVYTRDQITISSLKKLHNSIYGIALVTKKKKIRAKGVFNKYLFLSEILSDALTIPCLLVQGFINPSLILMRRVCENFFNHIYYHDHPVEFSLLINGSNAYVPMIRHKEYAINHPENIKDQDRLTSIHDIFNEYQELCNIVHTKGIEYMSLTTKIQDIKLKNININQKIERMSTLYQQILFVIFKFHKDLKYSNVEKGIVSSAVTKGMRGSVFNA